MTAAEILKLVLIGSIFLTVFALAMRGHAGDAFYLFREWKLGLRALVAMFVVVPAAAMIIVALFDLRPGVEVAIVALALSPMPPIVPKKQLKEGGTAEYITGLLVMAGLASIILIPLGLLIAGALFGVDARLPPAQVATTVGITILVPLALGLLAGRLLGAQAAKVSHAIGLVATVLLAGGALVLLFKMAPAMWEVIGNGTLLALIAMIGIGVVSGYLLAGPDKEQRVALALASGSRHPGLAIAIVGSNFPDASLAPAAIILSLILNAIVAAPLLHRLERMDGTTPP